MFNWMFFSLLTDEMTQASVDLGEQFTEIFIKSRENVSLLISLLEVLISLLYLSLS